MVTCLQKAQHPGKRRSAFGLVVRSLASAIVCTSSSWSCWMGKKGHQKFTDVWANQTNLGKQFGLSPIAMGKKLKELGLRGEDGNPTAQALGQDYCTSTPLKD